MDVATEAKQGQRPAFSRGRRRPLRIFPFDPMLDRFGRSVIADVPYEEVEPGPSGRLVQVIDYDATRDRYYQPVDLNDPAVLINQGLDLAEFDPRFHQQMVYAVVMRVLEAFERGLGRPFRWRSRRRLRIYPHAFEGENAYFDERLFALLFGYFTADPNDPGPNLPRQTVFTCLSHDVVAHETSHAILHRVRPHFSNPTNPDVLAFHEGFADVVAILQHFTHPAVLSEHIGTTHADLTKAFPMLSLAAQFGFARGSGEALRTALTEPDTQAYERAEEEHDRGAVLAAAVIHGFLRSYEEAVADVVRIATAGSGVLQPGALHPDLVARLCSEAADSAEHILTVCTRAFDYLPPCDVTFGDYLRALVTADFDVNPEDRSHRRANLIEGFRARGIYPSGIVSLGEQSLRIAPVDGADFSEVPYVRERLLDAALEFDRRRRSTDRTLADDLEEETVPDPVREQPLEWGSPQQSEVWAQKLHAWAEANRGPLGLDPKARVSVAGFHSAQRVDTEGFVHTHIALQLVQREPALRDELGGVTPMGGATVIVDAEGAVQHVVRKQLPQEGSAELDRLRSYIGSAEHRLRSPAWSRTSRTSIIDHLNLRSLDAARR